MALSKLSMSVWDLLVRYIRSIMHINIIIGICCLLCVLNGCKKDNPVTVSNCPERMQYIEHKHVYYNSAGVELFTIDSPTDSDGTYYFFCGKEAKNLLFYLWSDTVFYCLSPVEIDSTYYPGFSVHPVWNYRTNQDTLVADLLNPGDTIVYNGIERIRIVLVKSNFVAANEAVCN